jgi:hypothetical protein
MKKYILLVVVFLSATMLPAQASLKPIKSATEIVPSIAVIDTGLNGMWFNSSLVAEACFLEFGNCINGKQTMEGPGAATLPTTRNAALDHGSQMVSVIKRVNPDAKIVFIRIVGVTSKGDPNLYTLRSVKMALDWVIANQAKYNISVVNLSQGAVIGDCDVPVGMPKQISDLKAINVPVIVATGNTSNRTKVNSPACLGDTVSVGATDNPWKGAGTFEYDRNAKPYIARYSNGNNTTDFYLNGRWTVTNLNNTTKFMLGTSNAAASLSAWWLMNKKATFDETYNAFATGATIASNEWLTGRYIQLP